jgi:hypothetical protein
MTLQYKDRCMSVDGKKYCQDLKIFGNEVHGNWWRKQGHRVEVSDLKDILSANPDVMVIGMGYAGFMEVPDSLRLALKERNIELISDRTPEAAKAFNSIQSKGKKIAGAFHLTC